VVVKAHISAGGGRDDARTTFADDIEREDKLAEEKKRKGEKGCVCS
jgi:hypothetical protein